GRQDPEHDGGRARPHDPGHPAVEPGGPGPRVERPDLDGRHDEAAVPDGPVLDRAGPGQQGGQQEHAERRNPAEESVMTPRCLYRPARLALAAIALLALAACGKVELYGSVPEQDANEMLAVLLSQGIDAVKTPGKEGKVGIGVDKSDLAHAVDVLRSRG